MEWQEASDGICLSASDGVQGKDVKMVCNYPYIKITVFLSFYVFIRISPTVEPICFSFTI